MTKLCLALEAFRRTDEGRIRDAKAFLAHFFPQDKSGAKDRMFLHMPNEVRADLLSNWGIRGKKSALRDDDDRVRNTVNDALNAGDIDAPVIEEGITPEILMDWLPLEDWWSFWRGSALPLGSVRKALATARDLSLFDERWFLDHLALKTAKLEGIDVVCAALSKEQIVQWIAAVHHSGDASPTGLVAAVGWETILAKTAHEALLFALDALARQIGLVDHGPDDRKSELPAAGSAPPPPEPPPTPRLETPSRAPSGGPNDRSALKPAPSLGADPVTPEPPTTQPKSDPPPPATKKPESIPAKPQSIPITNKTPPPIPASSKQPPAMSKPPPVPVTSKAPPGGSKAPQPPPIPVSKPPGKPPPSFAPPMQDLPSVIIEQDPPFFPNPPSNVPAAPASTPPNARSLFLGASTQEPPPMRARAETIVGVAPPPLFSGVDDDVAMPTFSVPPSEPEWAPPRAEPGDMGWDLVHGMTRPMGTNVQPKYNFTEDDDEPTSEIRLPTDVQRR